MKFIRQVAGNTLQTGLIFVFIFKKKMSQTYMKIIKVQIVVVK